MTVRRKLSIAITVDPEIPVPPKIYGGIERIADMLIRGLVKRGHEVTLFAHPDSDVPCKLVPYPGLKSQSWSDLVRNMWHVSSIALGRKCDLVQSFARLAYLLPLLPLKLPKVMSYQRFITPRSVAWGDRLSRGTLQFTGCSQHIVKPFIKSRNWHVIYNGVPMDAYQFRRQLPDDAPLVYLGRVEEIKGPHLAIQVAQRSGRALVIAGNVPEGVKHQKYFQEKIAPRVDGCRIQYIGPMTDEQKNALLGKSAALLMPILWEEPFGIVMAEALACGTPVIGLNRGAVPEVVQNGVNGFVCETVEEMAAAVGRIKEIDRRACLQIMEEKFSDRTIVDQYEKLYMKLIGNGLTK